MKVVNCGLYELDSEFGFIMVQDMVIKVVLFLRYKFYEGGYDKNQNLR